MKSNLCILFAATLLAGCGFICENEISQSVTSPSGRMKAVTFHRNCGATVGFNTQVSILRSNQQLPNQGGNIFIIDRSVPLETRWDSNGALTISGAMDSRIFKQEASVADVRITYTKLRPPQ